MPNTYSLDLRAVRFPKKIEEKLVKERKQRVAEMIAKGIKEEDAERVIPEEKWDGVATAAQAIEAAMAHFLRGNHWDKERNQVVAPAHVRRLVARITFKLSETDGEMTLTSDEMDFMVKVFESDLPPADVFIYAGDAVLEAKTKQVAEEPKS